MVRSTAANQSLRQQTSAIFDDSVAICLCLLDLVAEELHAMGRLANVGGWALLTDLVVFQGPCVAELVSFWSLEPDG